MVWDENNKKAAERQKEKDREWGVDKSVTALSPYVTHQFSTAHSNTVHDNTRHYITAPHHTIPYLPVS